MVAPELGTFTNPILITDDLPMSDSALEGWHLDEAEHLHSDASTERMTTPDFWGALAGENLACPGEHGASATSSSIHVPTESLEGLQSVKQLQSDHRTLNVPEDSVCDHVGAVRRESVANDHEGTLT